jgi:hypothetical protein
MFTQTWKKYLPVIILLMKRSDKAEQVLDMNYTDFQRAAGGKKIKLNFSNLQLNNGRINYDTKSTPLATDLINVLQENKQAESLLRHKQFEFAMNANFQLIIKNNTPVKESDAMTIS